MFAALVPSFEAVPDPEGRIVRRSCQLFEGEEGPMDRCLHRIVFIGFMLCVVLALSSIVLAPKNELVATSMDHLVLAMSGA